MASIRRQQITRYLLNGSRVTSDGKPVTKDTPGAVKTVEFSAKWYAYDVPGHSKPIPLATNEKVSRRMLDNIERSTEVIRGSRSFRRRSSDGLATYRDRAERAEQTVAWLGSTPFVRARMSSDHYLGNILSRESRLLDVV